MASGYGGQYGTALKFDGGNQAYVEVGAFRIGGDKFFRWAYKENLGNWQRMFDLEWSKQPQSTCCKSWYLQRSGMEHLRGGNNRPLRVQDFWTLNEWQHVVATVDDSGLMKIYRNGQRKGATLAPSTVCYRTRQYIEGVTFGNNQYFRE